MPPRVAKQHWYRLSSTVQGEVTVPEQDRAGEPSSQNCNGTATANETLLSMDQASTETLISMDLASNKTLMSMDLASNESLLYI